MSVEFDNIKAGCGQAGVPTAIPDLLNGLDDTEFEASDEIQYDPLGNDIGLTPEVLTPVQTGFTTTAHLLQLRILFNEMFHAIYDQLIEEQPNCPLNGAMRVEARRYRNPQKDKSLDMVEEALSETLSVMVATISGAHLLGTSPVDLTPAIQPPGHGGDGERFADQPDALVQKPPSKDICIGLAYFLYFGCTDTPRAGKGGQTREDYMLGKLRGKGVIFS